MTIYARCAFPVDPECRMGRGLPVSFVSLPGLKLSDLVVAAGVSFFHRPDRAFRCRCGCETFLCQQKMLLHRRFAEPIWYSASKTSLRLEDDWVMHGNADNVIAFGVYVRCTMRPVLAVPKLNLCHL